MNTTTEQDYNDLFSHKSRQDMCLSALIIFLDFKRVDRDFTPFHLAEIRQ